MENLQKKDESNDTTNNNDTELERERRRRIAAEERDADAWLATQQMAERSDAAAETQLTPICPAVAAAAGLVEERRSKSNLSPKEKQVFKARPVKVPPRINPETGEVKGERSCTKPPLVTLNVKPKNVKARTGFKNANHMLAYIIVICNGDLERIGERRSSLTWWEEWFLCFKGKYNYTSI